jgi:hypothetical protein
MEPWPGFDKENEEILAEIYSFKQEFFDHQLVLMKARGVAYFQDRWEMDKCQHISYAYEALIYYKNENQLKKYEFVRNLLNQLIHGYPTYQPIVVADEFYIMMRTFGIDFFLKREKGEEIFYVSCAYELLIYFMQEELYERCSYIQYLINKLKSYFPRVLSHIVENNKLKPVVSYSKKK